MSGDSQARCWVCGSSEPLTSEHVPPRSAFNERPVILQQVSDEAIRAGYVGWEDGNEQRHGHSFISLCSKCNHRAGRSLVPSYRDFVYQIAERVSTRIPLEEIRVPTVRNPQLILRQVLMQFVSSNGASFVDVNPWIKPLLLTRREAAIPDDVYIYLFATQTRGLRTSGISGHVLIDEGRYRILSEFTHWPLGTVLSFTELRDLPLFPIREWSRIPFNSKETVDVMLPVNPIASALPVDFRDDLDIWIDMGKKATALPDESLVIEMMEEVSRRSGYDPDDSILTGSPALVALHADEHR